MSSPRLSVVMPVYNEAEGFASVLDEIQEKICSRMDDVEVVVVDDASTDGTPELLEKLRAAHPYLRTIRHPQNMGHGPAVRTGLLAAAGDLVLQMDGDGQVDPGDFWRLHEGLGGASAALGWRHDRQDPAYRLVISACVRRLITVLFDVRIRDCNCAMKLFRRSVVQNALGKIDPSAFAPSILLGIAAARTPEGVVQMPITHRARTFGASSLSIRRFLRLGPRIIKELLAHRSRLR